MKNLLSCLLVLVVLVNTSNSSETFSVEQIDPFIKAKGKQVQIDGHPVWMMEIPESVYKEINVGRKLLKQAVIKRETVLSEPYYLREYVRDWVSLVQSDLINALGRDLTDQELFYGWMLGIKKFQKAEFDPKKVKDDKLDLKYQLFQIEMKELKRVFSNITAPPLPGDGRPLVPRRYSYSGPDFDEIRSRFR